MHFPFVFLMVLFYRVPSSYVTAYLGTFNPHGMVLYFGGDYSYGIYIYGFPSISRYRDHRTTQKRVFIDLLLRASRPTFAVASLSWCLL